MQYLFPRVQRARRQGQLVVADSIANIRFRKIRPLIWLTDIENTIALRGERRLDDATLAVFRRAHQAGVRYIVLVTNRKFKVAGGSGDFSEMVEQLQAIGFDGVYLQQPGRGLKPLWALNKWPRKPWKAAFRQALQLVPINVVSGSHVLATGDKLRFDVLRPLRMHYTVVLVNPLGPDGKGDRYALIRPIENLTLKLWGVERASQGGVA